MIFKPITGNGPTTLYRPDSPLQELVRRLRKLLQPWSATRRDGLTFVGA